MKILVTGASGFLGSCLVKELVSRGFTVWGHGRNEAKLSQIDGVKAVIADLSGEEGLQRVRHILANEGIDAVVNTAALCDSWGSKDEFLRVNTHAATELYRACVEYEVKHFVQISSPSVFASLGDQLDIPDDAPFARPLNDYAWSKQEAEKMLMQGAREMTRLTILRPQAIFGDGDPNLLPRLVRASQTSGIPLINDGQHLIDITPVETVVQAICLCLEQEGAPHPEVYNISNGEAYSFKELTEMIFDQIGEPVRWKKLKLPVATIAANMLERIGKMKKSKHEPLLTRYSLSVLAYSRTLSIEKAQKQLNFEPHLSVKNAIKKMNHG